MRHKVEGEQREDNICFQPLYLFIKLCFLPWRKFLVSLFSFYLICSSRYISVFLIHARHVFLIYASLILFFLSAIEIYILTLKRLLSWICPPNIKHLEILKKTDFFSILSCISPHPLRDSLTHTMYGCHPLLPTWSSLHVTTGSPSNPFSISKRFFLLTFLCNGNKTSHPISYFVTLVTKSWALRAWRGSRTIPSLRYTDMEIIGKGMGGTELVGIFGFSGWTER